MTRVRTGRRLPVFLGWNDSDLGSRSAGRTDPKEVDTSDVVTSKHGSRGDSAQVEKSLERGVKEETAVFEASGRKQDSNERLVEAIGRGQSVCTKGSGGHSENHDWKGIRDIVGGNEDTEDVEKEEEEDIYHSVCTLEDMPLMQRQNPELAEIITYL